MRSVAFALLLTTTVLAQTPPAEVSPEKRAEAKQHFSNGLRKFDVAKFDEAAAEFVAAYEIMGDPGMLYNIAQAYRLGERQEKALFFYKAFQRHLSTNGKASPALKAEVEKRIAELTQVVANSKHAATAPPTGTLSPDQTAHPETKVAETSKPPPHVPQEKPQEPTTTPPPPPPHEHTAETPPPPEPANNAVVEAKPHEPTNPATLKWAGIGVGALAVAAIATGAGLSGAAAKDSQNLQTASMQHSAFGPNLQASEHNGKLYDTVSFAMYGVAGAAAVASAVLLYFGMRPQHATHAQVTPSFGPGSAGVALTGRF